MKIALVITTLAVGGAETQVTGLADRFAEKGHQVLLVCLTGEAVVIPLNPMVELVCLNMMSLRHFAAAYKKLRSKLLEFRPDVVHSHMVHANILCRLVRIFTPIKRLVCTSHTSNEGSIVRMWAYRFTDRLSDINTNVSEDAVCETIRRGAVRPGGMIAVHNGIDTEKFRFSPDLRASFRASLGIGDSSRMLLAVGRLSKEKDYPTLLNAFAKLTTSHNDLILLIVGEGGERNALVALADRLNIGHRVFFLGVRRDIPVLMSAADVFVLSSAWEGFGLVVAEAMACERIVVATDCGGVREVLGENGLLVSPGNSIALAEAVHTALEYAPDQRAVIGKSARSRVKNRFSLDAVVEVWCEIYSGAITIKRT